jgi:hypothetical protein
MKHELKTSQKKKIIETIFSCLYHQYKEITIAYLFGSFVTEKFFADIDLGILTKMEMENTLNYELEIECKLEKIVRYKIDVRVINKAPLSFCQNVIRYGKVILDRDPNLRADFEGKIFKLYFDFSRFRQQYLNEVINAPV